MSIKLSTRIELFRSGPTDEMDTLWYGALYRVPCIDERVTMPTREGPRTYRVSRVITDVHQELYTVQVVKVKDAFDD